MTGSNVGEGRIGQHNYELNAATVLHDLYRLLCTVASERRLLRVIKRRDDPLLSLRGRFAEDEIVHLLVQTAVMNRLQLDHLVELRKGDSPALPPIEDYVCGSINEDVAEKDEMKDLTFREACNKIVHAKQIAVERDAPSRDVFDRMPEGLILRGTRNVKAWQAHLSIYDYIRASTLNFVSTEPNGRPRLT
jgi:hypothetical protein